MGDIFIHFNRNVLFRNAATQLVSVIAFGRFSLRVSSPHYFGLFPRYPVSPPYCNPHTNDTIPIHRSIAASLLQPGTVRSIVKMSCRCVTQSMVVMSSQRALSPLLSPVPVKAPPVVGLTFSLRVASAVMGRRGMSEWVSVWHDVWRLSIATLVVSEYMSTQLLNYSNTGVLGVPSYI